MMLESVVVLSFGVEVSQAVRNIRTDKVIAIRFFIDFLSVIYNLGSGR
jgi:hypothetical protein